jgi:hypothetical protein
MRMRLDCKTLYDTIEHSISLVRGGDTVRHGALRMETRFVYPNGSSVDVFLEQRPDLLGSYVLSDFGQTALYLHDAQVNLSSTERRRQILGDICSELGVSFGNGSP